MKIDFRLGSNRTSLMESVPIIAKLREEEAAAVADLRIVHPELMAVVAQGQRLGEVVGKRLEAAEMGYPARRGEFEPNMLGRAMVEEARDRLGKFRRIDRIVEFGPEAEDLGVGPVSHLRLR